MTPAEKLVLQGNMEILEAEDELRAGVSDERVYEATLAATGSEERAAAALTARIALRQREATSNK